MKKQIVLATVLLSAIAFAGCEKCTTCNYNFDYKLYDAEGILLEEGNQSLAAPEEFCGNNKDVDDFEADFQSSTDTEISSFESAGYIVTINKNGCERD